MKGFSILTSAMRILIVLALTCGLISCSNLNAPTIAGEAGTFGLQFKLMLPAGLGNVGFELNSKRQNAESEEDDE